MLNGCFTRVRCLALLACGLSALPAYSAEPEDAQALQGIRIARGVFDVSRSRPDSLLGAMKLVAETRGGLIRQRAGPDLAVLFRGPAVTLLSTDRKGLEPVSNALISLIALQQMGYALVPLY